MSEVLAGLVCGYVLALVSTPLLAITMVRVRPQARAIAIAVPEQVPLVALTMVLFWFTFLLWTAIGMVFGLILAGFEDRVPEGGLGSPSLAFTLFVIVWSVVAFGPFALLLKRWRRHVVGAAVVFAVLFGWFMPYLAQWGPVASS